MIRAGDLKHELVLRSAGGTRDTYGEQGIAPTVVATVYGKIEPLSTQQQFLAAQQQSSTTHVITVRYCSEIAAIDASWTVLYGTRVFAISGVRNIEERNRVLELDCVEGLAAE